MDDDAEKLRAARVAAQRRGAVAEDFVADDLVRHGATLLARNWRGGGGELDLVAQIEGRLRFVEVKARHDDVLDPLESIGPQKRRHLVSAAEAWLSAHGVHAEELAFLVAVVDLGATPWSVRYLDNAFDAG